jgi:hypothetical protein
MLTEKQQQKCLSHMLKQEDQNIAQAARSHYLSEIYNFKITSQEFT